MGWKDRTTELLGEDATEKLSRAKVLLFGLGGVGGTAAEALVRAGVGTLDVFDGDIFEETNLNRQILSTLDNVGRNKAECAKERFLKINPSLKINAYPEYFTKDTKLDFSGYDYVSDAIDSTKDKLEIYIRAKNAGVPIISSMGTGNRLTVNYKIADLEDTSGCPLAKTMRKLCRDNGITGIKAVYSDEEPLRKSPVPASISFSPSAAGLTMAAEIIKDIIGGE